MTLAMNWDEWAAHDAVGLADRVRRGELTPGELARQAAAGIAKINPSVSAVVEVFEAIKGRPARTFPSVLPLFRLDRIYARGLDVIDARVHYAYPGRRLSDHAALAATFELAAGRR